ncbi:MAG: histidine kinase [Bryobacteraceae bacterium]
MKSLILLIRLCAVAVSLVSAAFTGVEVLYRRADGTPGCLFEALVRERMGRAGLIAAEIGLIALFAVLFWLATRQKFLFRLSAVGVALMAAQVVLATLLSTELLLLVAIEAALLMPLRMAIPWVVTQSAVQVLSVYWQVQITGSHPLLGLFAPQPGHMEVAMLLMALTSQVWHWLSLGLGLLAASAVRQAMELQRVVAELRATQQVEAATARLAERLSISRELHDSSGHHLAALNVSLRLMRHIPQPVEMAEKIDECLLVVKQLLSDVRGVVRDLRQVPAIDLKTAVETMADGMPSIRVHVLMAESLASTPPFQAHALFRCAQEILTNAVKHSNANNLWLKIDKTDRGIRLEARDDGLGASRIIFGNGLRGMEERVAEMGGTMEVYSRAGQGFRLTLGMPLRERMT